MMSLGMNMSIQPVEFLVQLKFHFFYSILFTALLTRNNKLQSSTFFIGLEMGIVCSSAVLTHRPSYCVRSTLIGGWSSAEVLDITCSCM